MEVMIPPWVRPESPETIRIIDDATVAFQPAFGRGMTQRGIFADPRWGLRRRYRGLRSDEKAAILGVLNDSRGQLNVIRVTPHTPIRGSFATSELLTNSTFASGTTGWSAANATVITISSQDRFFRVRRNQSYATADLVNPSAPATVVQYAPYAARIFEKAGRGTWTAVGIQVGSSSGGAEYGSSTSTVGGMKTLAFVPSGTSAYFGLVDLQTDTVLAGDYYESSYFSLARCALVDNGANLLLHSDNIDSFHAPGNAVWTGTRLNAVGANSVAAPDGTTTAEAIQEDSTASNTHLIAQSVTVSSAAADYTLTVALKGNGRNWAALEMNDGTSSVSNYFNITSGAGAVGASTTVGGTWANLRYFIADLGNGWFQCTIVARKTGSSTSLAARIYLATSDGGAVYSGGGVNAINAWRATLVQSPMPVRLSQTTSTSASSATQSGSAIYTKGWPVSTSGLLLAGDWVEINGELKQLTAPINSDAIGLAYMQFRPSLAGSPSENDPIIVQEPFGRFIYPGGREFENLFGIYGDCEMNLEEVYS